MDRAAILERVIALVCETLEADEDSVDESTTFDDLNADSFDKLELVTAFEDEFDLTLDDEVLASINSIGDAVYAIENAQ
ncbi:MAG: acyl carrier protein [Atopobium sp.]|uniref:acyl carrier protein n=1 Tax=Atopobium sp. TaxID=1872650 RepID=UPI002A761F94|nr:acyl carrier protein [Atopobium sp.]MDY2788049.1 acyl carrier protein [Atopobium sp.]MDY4522451.1 acyl carrier protein [Atopobium sp.]